MSNKTRISDVAKDCINRDTFPLLLGLIENGLHLVSVSGASCCKSSEKDNSVNSVLSTKESSLERQDDDNDDDGGRAAFLSPVPV